MLILHCNLIIIECNLVSYDISCIYNNNANNLQRKHTDHCNSDFCSYLPLIDQLIRIYRSTTCNS